jgi:nucleotide-binding universal stress UspA family protein
MKNIIVAFDFSKNSIHALEYAILYANKLETGINILWVDNSVSSESVYQKIDNELRIEKKSNLNTIATEYSKKLKYGNIKIHLGRGKVYQEIHKIAKKIDADFIFTGTHGVSGYEQYWIGSNVNRIVTSAPCPVVSLRNDYDFGSEITDILMPIDSSMETKQKLQFIAKLALKFNSRIHLLQVYNTPINVIRKRINKIAKEAMDWLDKEEVNYITKTIEGANVVSTLLNYVENNKIDLISIMTDQGTTTANKFLGPYANQLINNSKTPIISLRAKEFK